MRSCLLMPSGMSLGMAATHVRNRSILGFLSPLPTDGKQSDAVTGPSNAEPDKQPTMMPIG